MPRGKAAYTTVGSGTCTATFTPKSATRPVVIAHEACHCALDANVLGPYGYEGVTASAIRTRERAVSHCAARVLKGP
jgi:hypothetical protein